MRRFAALAVLLLALAAEARAQPQQPATLIVTPGAVPNLLQVLDASGQWTPVGQISGGAFTPFCGAVLCGSAGSAAGVTFTPSWAAAVTSDLQTRGQSMVFAADFGASGSVSATTGSIAAGGAALTLAAAQDFKNGQGVLIGGNPALANPGTAYASVSPPSCSAVTAGQAGATAITYFIAPLDSNGGYGAAASCPVANANEVAFVGHSSGNKLIVESGPSYGVIVPGGIVTGPGVAAGNQIYDNEGGGTYGLTNTPSPAIPNGTTLGVTFGPQQNVALTVNPGALGQFTGKIAANVLTVTGTVTGSPIFEGQHLQGAGVTPTRIIGFKTGTGGAGTYYLDTSQTVASETMTTYVGYALWKQCTANCNGIYTSETYLGPGDQTTYVDAGLLSQDAGGSGPYRPSWLPATHPTAPQNDWCVRGVLGGGGTTALTLASACPNAASGQVVQHDDTAALNACLAVGVAGNNTQCNVAVGDFNVSSALVTAGDGLIGCGQFCTQFNWWGTQDFLNPSGQRTALQGFLVTGQSTDALGNGLMADKPAAFGPVNNIYFQYVYDGIYLYQPVVQRIDNAKIAFMVSQTGSCLHIGADSNAAIGLIDYSSCSVAGGTVNYGARQKCYWFDGLVGGGNYYALPIASCAGEGLRVSNDRGASNPPFGLKIIAPDAEFTIGPGIHITGGAQAIKLIGLQSEANAANNFVSCAASAGLVIDAGTSGVSIDGGIVYANSGDGVYSNGENVKIALGSVYNNSNRVNGGLTQTCAGVHIGPNATYNTITGSPIGVAGGKQLYPVQIDAGAIGTTATGNAFNPNGQVNNYVLDNGTDTKISCNSGSTDPYDCNGPPVKPPGPAYVGFGDLGLSGAVSAYWGLPCYTKTYAGNVADIWDAATGSTTETLLKCTPGGFLAQTVNPLAATCANGCAVKEFYDQSAHGYDFIQATNTLRPSFAQTGCGLPHAYYQYCAQFNATQYMQTGTVTALSQPLDLVAVAERTGAFTTSGYILQTGAIGAYGYMRFNTSANTLAVNFGASALTAAAGDSAWHVLMAEGAGATGAIQVDATLTPNLNFGSGGASTQWTLGGNGSANLMTANFVTAAVTAANGPNAAATNWPLINQTLRSWFGF